MIALRGPSMQLPQDERYPEAIESVRKRTPISRDEWDTLTAAEREHAFTVANVAELDVLQQALDAIESAVDAGTTLDDFKADVGAQMIESWGGENPGLLENVFRTNIQTSYAQGRESIISAPAVKAARPYVRFDDSPSDRECPECEACGGKVIAQDDPWWDSHSPPLHYQCRCTKTPLSADEADDEGIDAAGPDVDVDDGFGARPTVQGSDWEPDPSRYAPELRAALAERLGR